MQIIKMGIKFLKTYFYLLLNKNPSFPLFCYLELTRNCNLRCRSCTQWMTKYKNPEELTNELKFGEIVQLLDDLKKNGAIFVHLAGGEALLRTDIIKIIMEVKKRNLGLGLTTNGTLLSNKNIRDLINAGLNNFIISLDSHEKGTHDWLRGKKGTFEKAIKAIRYIKKHYPNTNVTINTTINKRNYKTLSDIVKMVEELKCDKISLLQINDTSNLSRYSLQDRNLFFNTQKEIEDLEKEIKNLLAILKNSRIEHISEQFLVNIPNYYRKKTKFKCLAGKLICEIDPHGNVFPCYGLPEKMGNIRENSLFEIWNSKKAKEIRKMTKNCNRCWNNCQVEPALRFSLVYLIKNIRSVLKEYDNYLFN